MLDDGVPQRLFMNSCPTLSCTVGNPPPGMPPLMTSRPLLPDRYSLP
jgi:hypothetical protein